MADPAKIRATILALAAARGPQKTFCPSEVARALVEEWRDLMPLVRAEAGALVDADIIRATQKGVEVDPRTARGAIRLGAPK